MNRPILFAAVVVLALLSSTRPAAAEATWDLIYTSQFDVTLCSGCGLQLTRFSAILLVNTGTEDISTLELYGARFEVTGSSPAVRFGMAVYDDLGPAITPIQPGQALGGVVSETVGWAGPNDLLLSRLLPGEVLRNTAGLAVLPVGFQRVGPLPHTFEGPIHYDVKMTMAGRIAEFGVDAQIHLGSYQMLFVGASRVGTSAIPTPVGDSTWGRLKAQYR